MDYFLFDVALLSTCPPGMSAHFFSGLMTAAVQMPVIFCLKLLWFDLQIQYRTVISAETRYRQSISKDDSVITCAIASKIMVTAPEVRVVSVQIWLLVPASVNVTLLC